MQPNIQLKLKTGRRWAKKAATKIDFFLPEHADIERKKLNMVMEHLGKYSHIREIVPDLLNIASHHMAQFKKIATKINSRNLELNHEINAHPYITILMRSCRTGRTERLLDRLICSAIIAYREAERYKLIAEELEDAGLSKFYSESEDHDRKIGDTYMKILNHLFDPALLQLRIDELAVEEAELSFEAV